MNKKTLYLTFDCEVWSKNKNLIKDFYYPTLTIANFFEKEKIPITLFISLSRKFPNVKDYYKTLDGLLKKLKKYKYISVQPHLHFYDLPVKGMKSNSDFMDKYSYKDLEKMMGWALRFFKKYKFDPVIFRPAGYRINKDYYKLLKKFNLSSSNLIEDLTNKIKTYPISTFRAHNRYFKPINSIITPEIIPANKVHKEFQKNKSNVLVSNFHSFSVFSSTILSWHPSSSIKILRKLKDKFSKKTKESYEWNQMKKFIKLYKNKYSFKNF